MVIKLDTSNAMEKMEQLCTNLIQQEAFAKLRQMIDAFSSDEAAIRQYEQFIEVHHAMQQKEAQGFEISPDELSHYEKGEAALYENDIIRQFLYAQREFSSLHS